VDFIGICTRDHSCYLVVKNLSIICLCAETLWKPEFKGDKLVNHVKEISMESSIQALAWLLLAAVNQV
jgi:hypothetical protein